MYKSLAVDPPDSSGSHWTPAAPPLSRSVPRRWWRLPARLSDPAHPLAGQGPQRDPSVISRYRNERTVARVRCVDGTCRAGHAAASGAYGDATPGGMPVDRWGLHMIRTRLIRVLTAAAAAVVLTATGMAAVAAPAEGALTLRPRTYTAVMTPTAAKAGVATGYTVVVTNTSSVISALDRFVLAVPAGFAVTAGSVTAPRGGWTET